MPVLAQRAVKVHGTYQIMVSEDDNITLRDAKARAITEAKAQAMKDQFGEMVSSDIMIDINTSNEQAMSNYSENTALKVKGTWLGDTKPAQVSISYEAPYLVYNVEVWGEAREIKQAPIDVECKVLCKSKASGAVQPAVQFTSGDELLLSFRTPTSGYLAVYLLDQDDQASCLLPYKTSTTGIYQVKNGHEYKFFDRDNDAQTVRYRMTTKRQMERNQVVVMFSPNKFTKCNDITGDAKHPNSLSTKDFQKWQLKASRSDQDMQIIPIDLSILGAQ